jgi:flagellar assembly protein FliH
MKKMDSYKLNVIKADEVINSGKAVPLSCVFGKDNGLNADLRNGGNAEQEPEISEQEKIQLEMEQRLKKSIEESHEKGFKSGVEFQKQQVLPVLDAIAAMTKIIPEIRQEIIQKTEEQAVKLALAIAEKILNQEVTTRKEVILGVLKGALKHIAETEGMKIRLNPQDFRYMMEVKKDFLQSFDGVRNVIFEEDNTIKRGGTIVETMFGEVDARLENQFKEIKAAILPR